MKKICRIDGCEKEWRNSTQDICGMHYHRFYRYGTYERTGSRIPSYRHSQGYIRIDDKNHPLADSTGYVYEHRKVYYDAHGDGPFSCYICEKIVTWDTLQIDHYDRVKHNNNIENLNASCNRCNSGREVESRMERLRDKKGIELNGVKRTIPEWAKMVKISSVSMYFRLKNWDSIEDALTKPRGHSGPMSKRGDV